MPRWKKPSRLGRCPSCGYDRAGWNHRCLCIRTGRAAWTPERARLVALACHGDTPGEQWARREILRKATSWAQP